MKQPFFSICIPVYKNVVFLQRLLDSIMEQAFTDYEVIITDDSPDASVGTWLKTNYASPQIKYHKNPVALGTPENWNEAIRKAEGQWIKLMHDDDWFASANALAVFHQHILSSKSSFVFSDFYNVYLDQQDRKELVLLNASRWNKVKRYPGNLYAKNIIGPPSVAVMEASLAKKHLYDASLKWLVDLDGYIGMLQDGKAAHIEQPLVCIGIGNSQVTSYTMLNPSVEIPEGLKLYAKLGGRAFDHILYYDAWWRLLRNMGIRDEQTLNSFAGNNEVPSTLYKMMFWQRIFPPVILKIGAVSKSFMFFSWLLR